MQLELATKNHSSEILEKLSLMQQVCSVDGEVSDREGRHDIPAERQD